MKRATFGLGFVLMLLGFDCSPALGQKVNSPELWVVLVSIEKYDASIIPRRPGLNSANQEILKWLRDSGGWGELWADRHVLRLNEFGDTESGDLNRPQTRPLRQTSKNLDRAMKEWLDARVVNQGDVVLFVFSGRGARIDGKETLLPVDYKIGQPGWSPEPLIDRLVKKNKQTSVICWIDAPILDPAAPEVTLKDAGDLLTSRLARWPGTSAWVATGDSQPASGHVFSARLRAALHDGSQPLLASLTELNNDPKIQGLQFRHMGGVPPDLKLAKEQFRGSVKPPAELLPQRGHTDKVVAIAMQGDGQAIFTASGDSTIRVWNPLTPKKSLLRVLSGYLNGVTALATSTDGRYLIGGDGNGNVLVWDLLDHKSVAIPEERGSSRFNKTRVRTIAFLPEDPVRVRGKLSRRFVTVGEHEGPVIWTIDGKILTSQEIPIKVRDVRFSAASRPTGPVTFAFIGNDLIGDFGLLQTFDRSMKPVGEPIKIPGEDFKLELDPEGRWVAVGNKAGVIQWVNLTIPNASPKIFREFSSKITALRAGPAGLLAIGTKGELALVSIDHPDQVASLKTGESKVESIEFAPDGKFLAGRTSDLELLVWRLDEGQPPEPLKLEGFEFASKTITSMAFGPNAVRPVLVAGENAGGIRRWDLKTSKESTRIAPHRGMVQQISASRDGRYLLQVSKEGVAQVWDLKEGRNLHQLEENDEARRGKSRWAAGTFLPDGRLLMARRYIGGTERSGDLVVVDAKTGQFGEEPRLPEGFKGDFDQLIVSRDGQRVVASSASNRSPSVFIWDRLGDLPRIITDLPGSSLSTLDLSDDGKTLLTAVDGEVKLWDLDAAAKIPKERKSFQKNGLITAARLGPGPAFQVVFAAELRNQIDYPLYLWDGKSADDKLIDTFNARVRAVTFLSGGRFVTAAFEDGWIRAWERTEARTLERLEVRVDPKRLGPHHFESINDLIAWPQTERMPFLVSASDDSTVRFWKLDVAAARLQRSSVQLMGTLIGAPEEAPSPALPIARARSEAPWIAFTPDGIFDASLDGEHLVSFSNGREVAPLEQYSRLFRDQELTRKILEGNLPKAIAFEPPLPILIDVPEEAPLGQGESAIKVSLSDPSLKPENLRLYVNEIPVRFGQGFNEVGPGEYVVNITLKKGRNEVYAMASRENAIDARSQDRFIDNGGPETPGRIHVISIGIGGYDRNSLEFPTDDAKSIASFIQDHGVGADKEKGEQIILLNNQVNAFNVEKAFDKITSRVRKHPEDTVVVFVAGHTDLIRREKEELYSLLLPKFPFPAADPIQVSFRGPGLALNPQKAPPAGTFLPYAKMFLQLSNMDALQRIVIIDACQAEAVLDDPGVRRVQQLAMDRETRPSRINYFLASRKGEAAGESRDLGHGLLTYVMLRGMGDPSIKNPQEIAALLQQYPDADTNHDRRVTTQELHRFVDRALPPLADRLTGALRGPLETRNNPAAPTLPNARSVPPSVEASGSSFPLVELPRK